MNQAPLLSARNLVKSYRRGPEEVHALVGVTFDLHRGELVGLVGPSGSGKTTLLNLVVGWEDADEGSIDWEGEHVPAADRPWDELAILPQRVGLVEELSVAENIGLPLRLGGNPSSNRPHELMDQFGLTQLSDRIPPEISLGEQQRTGLARALVGSPALLLADEPTGHQDAMWAHGVFRALRSAGEGGTTSLIATHNEEVLKYVDRVLAIRDGEVHEETVAALRRGAH
ncbi:MAG: ABC transporter ATP-binding protein [Actinomycetota bacterium]